MMTSLRFLSATILFGGMSLALHADTAPVPILFYDFNSSQSDMVTSKGSSTIFATLKADKKNPTPLLSKDGEGVTGKPGDLALDLRSATGMGKNGEAGVAIVGQPPLEALKSLTLTGWFKCAETPTGGARLFDYTGEKSGFLLGISDGKFGLQVNGRGWNTNTLPPPATGVWVFFAVSYDSTKTQGNLNFYQGTAGGSLSCETLDVSNAEAMAVNATGILAIGNWPAGLRPLQGLLDNMAVYGSATDGTGALDGMQLQALYTAANAAH